MADETEKRCEIMNGTSSKKLLEPECLPVNTAMDSPFALTWATHDSGDVESYRKIHTRVVRRVHKLKRHLSVQRRLKKNTDYVHHTITQEDVSKDHKFWLIALLILERDLSYALQIKSLSQLDSKHDTKAKHKLFVTRLKRAIQQADLVVSLSSQLDNVAQLELLVYKEFAAAQLSMSLQKWDAAIKHLSLSRVGLQFLEEHGNAENIGKYKAVIDSDIDTLLIGAIHKSAKGFSVDVGDVAKQVVSQQHDSQVYKIVSSQDASYLKPSGEAKSVNELKWRSYTARVKDDSLGRILYKVQNCPLTSMDDFDSLTTLISQAIESHNVWLQNEIKEEDDEILSSYLQYTLTLTSLGRNVSLLTNVKPTEALTLLDKINQEVTTLEEIPGVFNDDALFESLEALKKYYTCLKWKTLADYYFGEKKYNKTLLLSSKIVDALKDVQLSVSFDFINEGSIDELSATTQQLFTNSQILSQLTSTPTASVADDIHASNNSAIVDLSIKPISVKPVLFDVAFNYIHNEQAHPHPQPVQHDTKSKDSAVESGNSTDGKKKGGLFGLFGR